MKFNNSIKNLRYELSLIALIGRLETTISWTRIASFALSVLVLAAANKVSFLSMDQFWIFQYIIRLIGWD